MARVLVVDDDVDTAHSLASLLNYLGHEVRAAFDGASALERVRESKPQFVLVDLIMPGMDGPEPALKINKVRPKPKLVGVTGFPLEEFDPRRQPFDALLFKPVKLDALLAFLEA
jgi:CheY-like chemotaxis protein